MPALQPFQLPQLQHQEVASGGSDLLGTLGQVAGTAVGTAVGGPLGGQIGGSLGGQLGSGDGVSLAKTAGDVASQGAGASKLKGFADKAVGKIGEAVQPNLNKITGALGTQQLNLPQTAQENVEFDEFGMPIYRNKGGMTPMSMEMPNQLAKGFQYGPLASVEYKQMGGKVQNHMKVSYHNPLMQKPSADK